MSSFVKHKAFIFRACSEGGMAVREHQLRGTLGVSLIHACIAGRDLL
jgi:hypothetical protein